MNKPPVVILAAGSSSRFEPLTNNQHKSHTSLFGLPLLVRTIKNLQKANFTDLIVVISSEDAEKQKTKNLLQNYNLKEINIAVQKNKNGMGDALLAAEEFLQTDQFCLIRGTCINAAEILEKMLNMNSANVVCAVETETPWIYGILDLQNDQAVGLVEKPEKGTEPSSSRLEAVYLLSAEFLQTLKQTQAHEHSLEITLNQMMKNQAWPVLHLEQNNPSLKYPWHLFKFLKPLAGQQESYQAPSARVSDKAVINDSHGPVIIEEGARVFDFATLVGPCYVGKNCLVGNYSFVRGSCIEPGASVGANAEVVRSILLPGSTMHYGYIADTILGENSWIGAGIITANKRLDEKTFALWSKVKW